ncbi:serine/threonine-protein kinase/endoribonuclease IRE1-like [Daphnia magna]|uniref:serine/threonine-protein kinase/endoribonuclease IRE1-like n=1 Tax=Daphnia magna TaxID=35525 RepID=UPI001E1BB74D|nr:serine/threonine-protein kinase/endoribonuclease IRE1-like [Daphnia magna]
MATEEQPKSEEHLPFQGKTLECKNQFFVGGILLFDGYWRGEENGNADAELERVKLKAPNLKKQVAIRRIKNEDCLDGWTVAADKLICLNHNNILRVFGYEEDVANGWRYFALEPYSATLYEYCDYEYNGPMPNESQVLYQITNGVSYLHGKGIVHGDLNPLNVVIAAQSRPVRMKISDFGLSKFSYSKQLSQKMKEGEIPFEMELCLRKYWYCYWSWTLSKKTDSLKGIKDASEDVIAAGCILFYYLKRGKHLFGNDFESILINLKEKNPVNLPGLGKNHLGENHFAYEPIKNMINPPGKGFNWLHIANEKFKEALSRKSRISVSCIVLVIIF